MIKPAEFEPVDSVTNVSPTDSVVYVTTASGTTKALIYSNGGLVSKGSKPKYTFKIQGYIYRFIFIFASN